MKVAVYYYPRSSHAALYRQMIRYGRGRFRLAKKHRATLSLGALIPVLFVTILPALAIIGMVSQAALYLSAGAILLYAAVVGSVSLAIAARHGWGYLPLVPAILCTIHTGLGIGFLMEMLRTIRKRG
jgi:hypothetical protein